MEITSEKSFRPVPTATAWGGYFGKTLKSYLNEPNAVAVGSGLND
jgi:hypothetical protein